jgi:hypothetical protein
LNKVKCKGAENLPVCVFSEAERKPVRRFAPMLELEGEKHGLAS